MFGGTSKAATVLSGATGRLLYSLACTATIWSVAILDGAASQADTAKGSLAEKLGAAQGARGRGRGGGGKRASKGR